MAPRKAPLAGVPRRTLVTGGAGFVGSHLCERLLARGEQVVCLDDFSSGSRANVAHLLAHPAFSLIEHDVIQPIDLDVTHVFNLACPASPPQYQLDPVRTFYTSVLGMMNILNLAQRHGCRVLQASTSEVYGDPLVHPQPERYWGHVNPIGLRSCYDEGKRAAETMLFDHHRQYAVDIKVARIFNTYGPRMHPHDGRVVSNFIRQALCNEPITIYGEGRQTRSFCYVDDLVDGLVRLMDSPAGITGPINLGNPQEFTMLELATEVISQTGASSRLVFEPLPSDDPRQRRPDIALAQSELGWQPRVRLDEGVAKTIAHFRQVLGVDQARDGSAIAPVPEGPWSAGLVMQGV
ncbi:UDP-glucuronic acid decarboxylase family protein [Aquabacterium sp. A3]|uniref:UDP-glucuronic acid decarboxylase family protein n=1 Tax=Aquabacterium sp. A3 TaxID=3132829 RepID=UPI00311A2BF8